MNKMPCPTYSELKAQFIRLTTKVGHIFSLNAFESTFKSAVLGSAGGPPLTQKSLTRFPLPRFLAYVCVSWGN